MPYQPLAAFSFLRGYVPSAPILGPGEVLGSIYRGQNVWVRPGGRVEVANGVAETSATSVGARIFPTNTQRATIAGALVSGRLPHAGLIRYENGALLFLSEHTSQQVYLDEVAASGVTTSATASRLRVAYHDGSSWSVFDAGFDKPAAPTVALTTGGTLNMNGLTSVSVAPWRVSTNAVGPHADIQQLNPSSASSNRITVQFGAAASGQTGWHILGSAPGANNGELRVVRRVRLTPRGTFSATNGATGLTGSGTRWRADLRAGDVVTIDASSYTVSAVTSDTAATLTTNYGGSTGAGKTMTVTTAMTEWLSETRDDRVYNQNIERAPTGRGVAVIGGNPFVWGAGEGANVIQPLDFFNPEHCDPARGIPTQDGAEILSVLAGDNKLFVLTPASLQVVTYTQREDLTYIIRTAYQPGFAHAKAGVLHRDVFYGFSRQPIRTSGDEKDFGDTTFAAPVFDIVKDWTASRVLVLSDPQNDAVIFCHFNGTDTTACLPFLAGLEGDYPVWGPPINISGQIVDGAVVNGQLYVVLLASGNYRVNGWEQGTGVSGAYVASPYLDFGNDGGRAAVKEAYFTGKGTTLRFYQITAGQAIPDVTSTGAAAASYSLSGSLIAEARIPTNIVGARGVATRVDLPSSSGRVDEIVLRGYAYGVRR